MLTMNKTETIGVRNLMLIKAKIVGMWLLRAAPKIILDVDSKMLLMNPKVESATRIDIIHEYGPINFSTYVYTGSNL